MVALFLSFGPLGIGTQAQGLQDGEEQVSDLKARCSFFFSKISLRFLTSLGPDIRTQNPSLLGEEGTFDTLCIGKRGMNCLFVFLFVSLFGIGVPTTDGHRTSGGSGRLLPPQLQVVVADGGGLLGQGDGGD